MQCQIIIKNNFVSTYVKIPNPKKLVELDKLEIKIEIHLEELEKFQRKTEIEIEHLKELERKAEI